MLLMLSSDGYCIKKLGRLQKCEVSRRKRVEESFRARDNLFTYILNAIIRTHFLLAQYVVQIVVIALRGKCFSDPFRNSIDIK